MNAQLLQRSCGCGGSCESCAENEVQRSPLSGSRPQHVAPREVHDVLRSPGAPLDRGVRSTMERAFGRDFSGVRVHADGAAAESAASVGARAYTVGNHIAFNKGMYTPSTAAGRHLLAHELAHTVQQRGAPADVAPSLEIGGEQTPAEAAADRAADAVAAGASVDAMPAAAPVVARAPQQKTKKKAPAKKKPKAGEPDCGRSSLRTVAGFDGTDKGAHISSIEVNIHTNAFTDVNLTWKNLASGTTVPTNPLHGSPGAGLCSMKFKGEKKARPVDCSDVSDSNTADTRCTPIGDFKIQGHACALGDDKNATRVSWFKIDRAIAFHNYPSVPPFPASHGCVRMEPPNGDWIHDNTIAGVTEVHVKRPPGDPGPQCWVNDKKRIGRPGYKPPKADEGKDATETPKAEAPDAGTPAPDAGVPGPDAGTSAAGVPVAEAEGQEPDETEEEE